MALPMPRLPECSMIQNLMRLVEADFDEMIAAAERA
jgi:hypothetical protein